MSNHNPYATPESDVVDISNNEGIAKIKSFKRFSTWWVVLLAMFTLSIYAYYWMVSRTNTINSIIPENKVSMWIPYTVIISGVINLLATMLPIARPFIGTISEEATANFMAFGQIAMFLSFIGLILTLVWVYKFRNRLNLISGSKKGDVYRAGPILTFFFQLYYMQYKINQMHDAT